MMRLLAQHHRRSVLALMNQKVSLINKGIEITMIWANILLKSKEFSMFLEKNIKSQALELTNSLQ